MDQARPQAWLAPPPQIFRELGLSVTSQPVCNWDVICVWGFVHPTNLLL